MDNLKEKTMVKQIVICDVCGNQTINGVYIYQGKKCCTKTCVNKAAKDTNEVEV